MFMPLAGLATCRDAVAQRDAGHTQPRRVPDAGATADVRPAPVVPGEALTVAMWEIGDEAAVFTTSVGDRAVIDQGLLRFD